MREGEGERGGEEGRERGMERERGGYGRKIIQTKAT